MHGFYVFFLVLIIYGIRLQAIVLIIAYANQTRLTPSTYCATAYTIKSFILLTMACALNLLCCGLQANLAITNAKNLTL